MRNYSLKYLIITGIVAATLSFGVTGAYYNLMDKANVTDCHLYHTKEFTLDRIAIDRDLKPFNDRCDLGLSMNFNVLKDKYDFVRKWAEESALPDSLKERVDSELNHDVELLAVYRPNPFAQPKAPALAQKTIQYNTLEETLNPPVTEYVAQKESCETKDYFTF